MMKQITLRVALTAVGLLSSLEFAVAQNRTHIPGHRTGSSAANTRSNASSGARMGAASTRRGTSARSGAVMSDRLFMQKAAHINIGEVKGGHLAHTRAVNASVRDYAQHMIEDHSSANNELKSLAARKGVRLPNDTDQKHKAVANRLAKLSGAPFDRAYMAAMVKGHQDAILLFQNQARNGKDPDARAWAAKMLPGLQKHLRMAQQLAGSRAVRTGAKMSPAAGSDDHSDHAGHDHDASGSDGTGPSGSDSDSDSGAADTP